MYCMFVLIGIEIFFMRLLRVKSEEPRRPSEGRRNVYNFCSTWTVLFNGELSIRYCVVSLQQGCHGHCLNEYAISGITRSIVNLL
jgi:hypothetical protein